MLKNKLILSTTFTSLFGGYFIYDYISRINPDYSAISILGVLLLTIGIFSLSDQGKLFWSFLSDSKKEIKKIHFPEMPEVFEGLGVVMLFCVSAMILIWFLDGVFLNLYNSLMQ